MFHSNTELLIDYWQARKGSRGAPARASIDPADLRAVLPQLFIIGRRRAGQYGFRLVGGMVDALHGGHLGGADPMRLWAPQYRASLQLAFEAIRRQPEPLVITAEGRTLDGNALTLEIVLAPLTGAAGDIDRFIGLYQPITPAKDMLGHPIETLIIRAIAPGGAADPFPRLKLAAVDGRRVAQPL